MLLDLLLLLKTLVSINRIGYYVSGRQEEATHDEVFIIFHNDKYFSMNIYKYSSEICRDGIVNNYQ